MLKRLKRQVYLFLFLGSTALLFIGLTALVLFDMGHFLRITIAALLVALLSINATAGGRIIRGTARSGDDSTKAAEHADKSEPTHTLEAEMPTDGREVLAEPRRPGAESNGRAPCQRLAAFPAKRSAGLLARSPILAIDDDYETYETLCSRLSGEYHYDAAFDEKQALIKIKTRRYSVILVNLTMPNLWGQALIRDVAAVAPTTPVILVTRPADQQRALRALTLGAFDYLTKPFDLAELELSIHRAVSHHSLAEIARRHEQQLAECAERLENAEVALRAMMAEPTAILSALMAVLEARNLETRGHSERVVAYSLRLARDLGLAEADMQALALGARLHDIADCILLKPEQLTSAEWAEMRKHAEKGAQIIAGIPALRPALPVIIEHHERWDGTGYPLGLSGVMIDIKARIFAVADALDAITSDRPYDPARSYAEAREVLVGGAGKQFDPDIVEAFCRIPLEEWAALGKRLEG
jgi:cyclic di-GMP phosphodiesterase